MVTPKDYEYLLLCDGGRFDTSQYPLLAEVFPDGVLPDLRERFLEGAATSGEYREAGLPNIEGAVSRFFGANAVVEQGALKLTNNIIDMLFTTGGSPKNHFSDAQINLDASLSNSIYGKSTTVQPLAYTVTYYVCYGG